MEQQNPSTSPLVLALGLLLSVTAIDSVRFASSWAIDLVVLATAACVGVLSIRSSVPLSAGSGHVLLAGWLTWALAGNALDGGLTVALQTALFAAVLLGVSAINTRFGSRGVALAMAYGFTCYLTLSAMLVVTTSLDPLRDGRLQLASLEPNQLARIAVIAAVASVYLLLDQPNTEARLGKPLALALVCVGGTSTIVVALTASRTGAAVLVLGLAVVALHLLPWRASVIGAAAAFACVTLLASGADVGLPDGFVTVADRSSESAETLSGRDKLWPAVLEGALENPVTGIGLGNDRAFMHENINVGWDPQHTHNLALHVLLTTGVVGLALFSFTLGAGLLTAAAQRLTLALALGSVALVDGVSEAVVRVPSFGWAAVCAACILVAPHREQQDLVSMNAHVEGSATPG